MKRSRSFSAFLPVAAGLLLLTGLSCSRYYKPITANSGSPEESANTITSKLPNKYFILRQGDKSYAIRDIVVDKTTFTLSATLGPVSPDHQLYLASTGKDFSYKDKYAEVLTEVHIYISSDVNTTGTALSLPLDRVQKIEVIEHDQKRTRSNYIVGGIGIGLGVMVVAGIIIAATKDSCPYVSVNNGDQYELQGELFGGAITPPLERADYLPLRASLVNGEVQLRISNELRERQFTNYANLIVAEHPAGLSVLCDPSGHLYTVNQPAAPRSALLNGRTDVLDNLRSRDNRFCSFDDSTVRDGINRLDLRFERPSAPDPKLVLHLKNSLWLDYLYGEFTRYFGTKYDTWKQRQQRKPPAELNRWSEAQQIPLTVFMKTQTGWKEIYKLKTVGPLANRTLAIPFHSAEAAGDQIELRLQTGFLFWELDYAALDNHPMEPIRVTTLQPSTATDQDGKSVLAELAADDNLYLAQPEAGHYAYVNYKVGRPPGARMAYTFFLHTKGYYQPIRDYKNKPDISTLRTFREPGALARFSLDRYRQIPKENTVIALNK